MGLALLNVLLQLQQQQQQICQTHVPWYAPTRFLLVFLLFALWMDACINQKAFHFLSFTLFAFSFLAINTTLHSPHPRAFDPSPGPTPPMFCTPPMWFARSLPFLVFRFTCVVCRALFLLAAWPSTPTQSTPRLVGPPGPNPPMFLQRSICVCCRARRKGDIRALLPCT